MSKKDDRIDALIAQNERLLDQVAMLQRRDAAKTTRIRELADELRAAHREVIDNARQTAGLMRLFLHGEKRIRRIQAEYEKTDQQRAQANTILRAELARLTGGRMGPDVPLTPKRTRTNDDAGDAPAAGQTSPSPKSARRSTKGE